MKIFLYIPPFLSQACIVKISQNINCLTCNNKERQREREQSETEVAIMDRFFMVCVMLNIVIFISVLEYTPLLASVKMTNVAVLLFMYFLNFRWPSIFKKFGMIVPYTIKRLALMRSDGILTALVVGSGQFLYHYDRIWQLVEGRF